MEIKPFNGFSVSFKKPKGTDLFNILVQEDCPLKASKIANDYMQKSKLDGYNEYGISKHILEYKHQRVGFPAFSRKGFQVVIM